MPPWDLPRQTEAYSGPALGASRATERRETDLERATCTGVVGGFCRWRGGHVKAEAPSGQAAQPMRERRPRLGATKPTTFRHPSGFHRPFPQGQKERHVGYRHAPHAGGGHPRSNSSNRGPRRRLPVLSWINPLHFIYPPALCWAATRVQPLVRRVLVRGAVRWQAPDTNLRALIQTVNQERGSRPGVAVGRGS